MQNDFIWTGSDRTIEIDEFRIAVGDDAILRCDREKKCSTANERLDITAICRWHTRKNIGQKLCFSSSPF